MFLLTLNQRVQGSNPCAPTTEKREPRLPGPVLSPSLGYPSPLSGWDDWFDVSQLLRRP